MLTDMWFFPKSPGLNGRGGMPVALKPEVSKP